MYLGCLYPRCTNGHAVGKKFCPKHLATPFRSKEEINAYRRGRRDAEREAKEIMIAPKKDVLDEG